MAVFGRFQVYYGKIKSELEIIREDYGYTNLSKAFAHWYLVNYVKVSEQELGEIIIDGNGDNGIDAITVNGEVMTLYQFKFPDREKNIEKAIDEKTVVREHHQRKALIDSDEPSPVSPGRTKESLHPESEKTYPVHRHLAFQNFLWNSV